MNRQILKPKTFQQPVSSLITKNFSSLSNYNSLTSSEAQKMQGEYLKMINDHKKEIETKQTDLLNDFEKHKKQIQEMKSDIENQYNRYNSLTNDINNIKNDISKLKDLENLPKYPEQGSIYDPYSPQNKNRTIIQITLSCLGGMTIGLFSHPIWGLLFTSLTFPRQYPYRVDYKKEQD